MAAVPDKPSDSADPGQPVPAEVLIAIQGVPRLLAMEACLRAHLQEMVKEQVRAVVEPALRNFEAVIHRPER